MDELAIDTKDLTTRSTDELRTELANAITITAKMLVHLAAIWHELESRGEDLSDLRTGLAIYLPLIAAGELDAEFVIRHAGQHMLIQQASRIPISLQRKLLTEEIVEVIDVSEDGQLVRRNVHLSRIKVPEIQRVFREGGLRTETEQVMLIGRQTRSTRDNAPKRTPGIRVDTTAKTLRIGNRAASLEKVLAVLSAYYDVDFASVAMKVKP